MRYVEIANPPQPTDKAVMRGLMDTVRAAHRERIWPEIDNPTAEQYAAMQHVEPPRVCRRQGSLSQAASATSCWLA
ncbi:hypothetical protein GCM10011504_25050 [Siccirubricoccus deserti]|nr:hypothetical protein GCM10011504_25050 [Siccirubricoccus deserti]